MFFYIFVFAVLAFLAICAQGRSLKDQKILGIISATIIVCVQGFRWRTGTDWGPYYDCFMCSDKYQVEYVEWGYYMFNKIIRFFTDSYTIFLLVQCGVIAYCNIKTALYFNVKNIPLVLLAGFAGSPFPVRFAMATALFFLAYRYIVERKLIKFTVIYVLAVLTHQISLLAFPFYFFCHRTYSNKVYYIIYFACCAIGLMTEYVFNQMFDGIAQIFNYLPQFSQDKLNAYMVAPEEENGLATHLLSYLNGAVFIFLLSKIKDIYFSGERKYLVLLNMYVFGLNFGRLFLNTVPYLSRVVALFSGGFILMIVLGITAITRNKSSNRPSILQYALIMTTIVYYFIIYYSYIEQWQDLVVPYYSIFSGVDRIVY